MHAQDKNQTGVMHYGVCKASLKRRCIWLVWPAEQIVLKLIYTL
ncbi:hypothetical protein DR72_4087 [Klebsiella aerogenes]|nr:hypothetical protein DR72_4087 [Klebsiella aerogenes]MBR8848218.1 hypothetical protein [Klebsiella variicola]SWX70738.1 Uncharacterised protein [Klebsiella pneumoniae]VAT77638.1 Uncharacterised protein [Klebsiella variicola]